MGIIMTGVLGIARSFVGGLIARMFIKPPEGAPSPGWSLESIVGAVTPLFAWSRFVA